MTPDCAYCGAAAKEGTTVCEHCGAPRAALPAETDFRHCPFCKRKLLALASPACSYCGKRLPDEYIKAREADLRRIADIGEIGVDPHSDVEPADKERNLTKEILSRLTDIF
jgi:hypothetical protein